MASTNSRPESESRPISAGSITRNVKKNSSEGLIVLSPEPGSVKFEAGTTPRPSSGSGQNESRAGSAGHVERKLLMARKSELAEDEPRRNSAGARISGGEHFMCSKGESCRGQQMSEQLHLKLKISHQKQPSNIVVSGDKVIINGKGTVDRSDDDDDDSLSSSSSDSDTDESEKEKLLQTEQEKVQAPLELKGEFLQAVMDENYHKAQELCQKILLLEPDNATCQEFHAVIVEKKKQDEEAEEEESGEDSEDSDDDDDEEEEEEEEENEDEEGESGEDEEDEDTSEEEDDSESDSDDNLPPGSLNLIMGGLPIRPSSSQKTDHC